MSIIINIVIFSAIFGYTIFTLTKFMKKSKEENAVHAVQKMIVIQKNKELRRLRHVFMSQPSQFLLILNI
ncbi:hypothetical protein ACWKSJ_12605 [Staphylococcus equorum]|jgi:hypothetical protein